MTAFALDVAFRATGGGLGLSHRLFGWPFVIGIGGIVGSLAYRLGSGKRRATENEIGLLLSADAGSKAVREITRRSFENYYKRQVENLFFGCLDRRGIERLVEAKGLEHVDGALAKGKGAILLLAHFGSFLLPLPFLGFRGYRVNQVTGRQIHASLFAERLWEWRRKEADRLPVKFIQAGRSLRPIYEALRRNEIVAIAFDGRDGTSWVDTDFFGGKARFSSGPFKLARRTGAAVLPTFMIRRDDDSHLLVLEEPFRLAAGDGEKEAAAEDTRNFAKLFAGYVGRYPCHFGMILPTVREEPVPENNGLPAGSEG